MEQFDLEEYLKNPNKKVITRDGRPVRIICTNREGSSDPIVALVKRKNIEEIYSYSFGGKYLYGAGNNADLFFAPEKKIRWTNIYRDRLDSPFNNHLYETKEEALKGICPSYIYINTVKVEWEE